MPTVSFNNGGGDWLLPLFCIYIVFWVGVLGLALTRRDLDPVTLLTWVLVIILVPIFGPMLYLSLAPALEAKGEDNNNKGGKTARPLGGTPWEKNPGHVRGKS